MSTADWVLYAVSWVMALAFGFGLLFYRDISSWRRVRQDRRRSKEKLLALDPEAQAELLDTLRRRDEAEWQHVKPVRLDLSIVVTVCPTCGEVIQGDYERVLCWDGGRSHSYEGWGK